MEDLVRAAVALGLVLSLDVARAEAEPAPSEDIVLEAKRVYEEAATAYEAHRYGEAIQLFRSADQLKPNPAFDFNIGLAYEDMGDPARALASYRSYLRRAPEATDRLEVDARIQRLEQTLGRSGVQQVTILSEPPGARVEIDGMALGVTPWTGEIQRGFHRLKVELSGHQTEERTFDLPPERAIDVPVTLTPVPPVESAPVEPELPPACEGACLTAIRPSSWVITSAGVLSLGVALVLELDRAEREAQAQSEPSQFIAAGLYDDAIVSQKWATAFALTGGALLVTGATLGILDVHAAKNPERVAWHLGCTRSGCAGSFTRRF